MEDSNGTAGVDFILLGLFECTRTHLLLFSTVLVVFLAALMGSGLMVLFILRDPRLRRPMHFLLSQLSLVDRMLVSSNPKMAANCLLHTRSISPAGCGLQMFLFPTLGGGECFLLAVMSYDRYVAICRPLRYHILMNWKLCFSMTLGSWLLGGVAGLMQAAVTLSFPYCHSREINHFFCGPSLVPLACADTRIFEFFMYVCCVPMLLIPLSLILCSYTLILVAVLRMKSTAAQKKAFATCSSHLAVVGLFYGSIMSIYMRPKSHHPLHRDKVVSAFYTIFTPVLNPLIYSVRNKEVKGALGEWLEKHIA
ncbi:LOW QUALITY PROTEIN: olfactory receptor 2T33-like [Ctenodactylus gundi]